MYLCTYVHLHVYAHMNMYIHRTIRRRCAGYVGISKTTAEGSGVSCVPQRVLFLYA